MILFERDWYYKHPNAIVDTKCKNQSFIRICALLREMGIKNHLFPLQLLNKDLQGIDTFDPGLTLEEKVMVAIEAKENPFFFMRECVRDPSGSIQNPISFRANRFNIAMYWLYLNHITTILQAQRQFGKSFSSDALSTWILNIACTNTTTSLLTKDNTLRTSNLLRLKGMIEELPPYLNQLTKNDIANTEEIHIRSLDNRLVAHLPSKSPKQALNVGRGQSAQNHMCDEAPYLYNIGISLPAMLASGTAAREIAKSKGEPYGTLIYSTAGKKDDRDGKYVYSLIQNSARWTEKFLDCKDIDELEQTIRRNSSKGKLMVFCGFNHRQLGLTDEFLRKAIENAQSTGEDRDRDYYGIWTSGTQSSPLPVDLTTAIRQSEVKEYYAEISEPFAYITRWYVPHNQIEVRMRQGWYIMSLDTSDAVGGDDIGMHITDVRTGETVAAGNYNETNLITFAEWLCRWLQRYPNLLLIIERRSTGSTIIDYLLLMLPKLGIDPFTRLYNKVVQEADEQKERYKEICKPLQHRSDDIYVKYKKHFGFATSATGATSRSELYSTTLLKTAKMSGDKIKDSMLIDQMLGLVIRNGRVDHGEGSHDDLVIALLLGHWLIFHGKNLQHYGIDSRDLLIDNQVHQIDNNPRSQYERFMQDKIRYEIEQLVPEMAKERDPYVAANMERQLRTLYSKLTEEDKQLFSVDELINTLRSNRQNGKTHQSMYR